MFRVMSVLLVSLLCGSVLAMPFQNGSFELGGIGPCNTYNVPVGSTLITGWTVSVGNIDWEGPPACGWQPSQGNNSVDLVGANAGGIGGLQQTFDTTGRSGSNMGWTRQTLTFVAAATSSTINFVSDVSASGGTLNAGAALDDVVIAPLVAAGAAVPLDWAQWAAMMLLLATAAWYLRKRRPTR